MRNDEINQSVVNASQKVVVFVFNGAVKTASGLTAKARKAVGAYEAYARKAIEVYVKGRGDKRGQQSIKDLSAKNTDKTMVEAEGKLKGFDNYAKQFNIDYSVMYDKAADKTLLIFQSKDNETMNKAFQNYMNDSLGKSDKKTSIFKKISEIEAKQSGAAATMAKGINTINQEAAQTAGATVSSAAKVMTEVAKRIQKTATADLEMSR